MNQSEEAREAQGIWEALQDLADLLWDRYEQEFLDSYLEKEAEKDALERWFEEEMDARD